MNIRNFKLDPAQFATMMAVSTSAAFRYDENGNRTEEQQGFRVSVVLPLAGYEKATLKVPTIPPVLSYEALADSGPVQIKPVNLVAALFIGRDGKAGLSLKADSVEVAR